MRAKYSNNIHDMNKQTKDKLQKTTTKWTKQNKQNKQLSQKNVMTFSATPRCALSARGKNEKRPK